MFESFMPYQTMMNQYYPWTLILLVWSLIWKGLALWKAARRGEKIWYVALLIINTVGLLEILYLYMFSKKDKGGQSK